MANENLKKIFGTWVSPLTKWKMYEGFGKLIAQLNYEYKNQTIYPSKGKVFRVFREVPYDELKVVILAQDPYHDGSATGIAMGNEFLIKDQPSTGKLSPTLSALMKEWDEDPATGDVFDSSLVSWCNQGVLMLNCALTVRAGSPESHIHLWRPWTSRFLTSLSKEKENLVYILLGRNAEKWKEYIINGRIIYAPHPQAENYAAQYNKTAGFYGSRIFSKANDALILNKQPIITW